MSTTKIHVGHATVTFGDYKYRCVSPAQAKFLASMMQRVHDDGYTEGRNDIQKWEFGWIRNKNSLWVGVHYSQHNRRWCINLIPCVTVWITKPGGKTP